MTRRSRRTLPLVVLVTGLVLSGGAGLLAPSGAVAAPATRITGFPSGVDGVEPGTTVPITIRLRGAAPARRATLLQARPAGGRWATAATATTARSGVARLRYVAPDRDTTVSLRVRVRAGGGAASATSGVWRLRVSAPEPGPDPTPEPGPDPTPADETSRVVDLVNQARGVSRTCGDDAAAPVPSLTREGRLDRAAQAYAQRMADEAFFSHTSPDGDGPGERITAQGYTWSAYGENIAAGQPTADDVMAAWLGSPGHCRNIMSPGVTQIGVGVARNPSSPYGVYWVQVFARPR